MRNCSVIKFLGYSHCTCCLLFRKYLREEDRILLAGRALVYCRGIITRKINCLGSEKADASSSLRRWSSTTSKSLSAGKS